MERISVPIYDDTVPITCTIAEGEVEDRVALIERLRAALDTTERTEHGLLLRFPARPDIEADVRRFAVDEQRCCRFWGFAVARSADRIELRWDGPPAARQLIDQLHVFFVGDSSFDAIRGLL